LKPTRGRISLGPDTGDPYSGMVVGFVLTRSVRDCAAALDAVEGPAIGDPFEIPRPAKTYLSEVAQPGGKLRIAFTDQAWSGLPLDPEVAEAVAATVQLLEDMGHVVVEGTPQFDYDAFLTAQIDLWLGHTAAFIDSIGLATRRVPSLKNLQTTTWAVYEAGKALPAVRLVAAEEHYNTVTRQIARFLAGCDILMTPTNTCLPLALDAHNLDAPRATVKDLFNHLAPIETFTALFNGTGHPALSLPLHQSRSGLPIGLQFVTRFGDEAKLFHVAAALEEAKPWRNRRPNIHIANCSA
jgi:amidase